MDRAGLTPAYAVEVGHWDEQQAHQATELQDPQVMARQILEALPQVVAIPPPTEVRAVLQRVEGIEWDDSSDAMKTYDDCFQAPYGVQVENRN
jgi:hypothetical protein